MMNMDLHIKLQESERENEKLHIDNQALKKELKEKINSGDDQTKEKSNTVSYNSNKDIAYNLYYHAKALSEA